MNLNKIHIGSLIKQKADESEIDMVRIGKFLKCSDCEIIKMYEQMDLPTNVLLLWSKLLEYDFFRIYTQHLILYSPPKAREAKENKLKSNQLIRFRKNIYTRELIEFILEMLEKKEKTKLQIIQEYRIPKTTLYKWIAKYNMKE